MTKCSDAPETLARRKLWVADLRSGKYEQGHCALRSEIKRNGEVFVTFCCLGVCCDRFAEELGFVWDRGLIYNAEEGQYDCFGEPSGDGEFLPRLIYEHLGFGDDGGFDPKLELGAKSDNKYEGSSCTKANDNGWTFAEIADEIERLYILPFENPVDATEPKQ